MGINVQIKKKLPNFNLDVSFSSEKNRVIGILGSSGSGKSMTLKSIAGIQDIDEGFISVDNKIFFDSDKKIYMPVQDRKVGYLFQNYALFPHMSVLDNLLICIEELSEKEKNKYVLELLQKFGVNNLKYMYPKQLSGGQKQRVAFARMLATKPEIILLDEPFSAIDTNMKWQLENLLLEFFGTYKSTVILVTHNKDEAYKLCDDIVLLSDGKSEMLRSKEEVFSYPKSIESAKILGYKNFSNIKYTDEVIEFENYEIQIPLKYNNSYDNKYRYMVLDSQKFSLDYSKDCLEFEVKLKYIVDEFYFYVVHFEIQNMKKSKLFVQITKNDSEYIEKLKNNQKNLIKLYYYIKDIIYLM